MKSYLKFLSRNKVYTIVNVVGLSVSLSFVIIIGLYSQMEFGRDKWHEKADRIYAVYNQTDDEGPEEVGNWAQQPLICPQFPDIEASCAISSRKESLTLGNQEKKDIQVMFTDPSFFRIFDFPLTMGDRKTVLTKPEDIVITDEMASLLFGDTDPMGKTVILRDSLPFTIRGVMKSLNHTYLRPVDMLLPAQWYDTGYNGSYKDPEMRSFGNWNVFFLAHEGVDLTRHEEAMQQLLAKNVWLFKPDCIFGQSHFHLMPLKEIYFSTIKNSNMTYRGDHKQSLMLFLGGLVVLLFAVLNYINLTLAQSRFRMREMAMRRLLGSQRKQVAARLMGESLLLSLISLVLALLLAYLVIPFANQMLRSVNAGRVWIEDNTSQIDMIQYADLLSPISIVCLVAFALLLGIVAGIAPALHISKAQPIDIVKGNLQATGPQAWRNRGQALSIIFQHIITMVLLGVALTMMLQMRHLLNAPLGYNHERLMEIKNKYWKDSRMTLLLDEVKKLSCIEDAALGYGSPLHAGDNNSYEVEGRTIQFQRFRETESWMQMLNPKVITDYGTTGPNGVKTYVTPNTLPLHGLPEDARFFQFGNNKSELTQIDGLIEPIHLHNILETTYEGRPQMIEISKEPVILSILLMRYQGDKQEAKRQVGEAYKKIFENEMEDNFNFFDDQLRACFDKELRIMHLIEVFTVIAFLIAMLGLLAMSTYYIQQRRKEVAIRKVFGSTSGEVLSRLLRRIIIYVAVAFVIAIPIIYKLAGDWLSEFSYRIGLSPWIFIVVGLTCLIVSLLTVIVQSWLAANENPINNIKTE